jgi:hypothetical protein
MRVIDSPLGHGGSLLILRKEDRKMEVLQFLTMVYVALVIAKEAYREIKRLVDDSSTDESNEDQ